MQHFSDLVQGEQEMGR